MRNHIPNDVENEKEYLGYRKLLSSVQWNVLQAVAKEQRLKEPTSQEFIQKYSLSASSVQRAIKALIDKELIYQQEGVYFVYNQFLSYWLRKQHF